MHPKRCCRYVELRQLDVIHIDVKVCRTFIVRCTILDGTKVVLGKAPVLIHFINCVQQGLLGKPHDETIASVPCYQLREMLWELVKINRHELLDCLFLHTGVLIISHLKLTG